MAETKFDATGEINSSQATLLGTWTAAGGSTVKLTDDYTKYKYLFLTTSNRNYSNFFDNTYLIPTCCATIKSYLIHGYYGEYVGFSIVDNNTISAMASYDTPAEGRLYGIK